MAVGQKLKRAAKFALERAKEPSSWAAVTAIGTLFKLNPELLNQVATVAPLVATGLLGVFLPEKARE